MNSASAARQKHATGFLGTSVFSASVSEFRAELERRRAEMRMTRYGFRFGVDVIALEGPTPEKVREIELLVAAAERLLDVGDRNAMFHAVHEVLANLVGTENFAIYEKSADGFKRTAFSGNSAAIPSMFASIDNARAVASTVVSLTFGATVVGLLVIFSFLPQKRELWSGDASLLRFVQRALGVGVVAFPPTGWSGEVADGA